MHVRNSFRIRCGSSALLALSLWGYFASAFCLFRPSRHHQMVAIRIIIPPKRTFALYRLTTGTDNTALGYAALSNNTPPSFNTAVGSRALFLNDNTIGFNTAVGANALFHNTGGKFNGAIGINALYNNVGDNNAANGSQALYHNIKWEC